MEDFEEFNIPVLSVRYRKKGWLNPKYLVELDAQSLLRVRAALKEESARLYSIPSFNSSDTDAHKRIIEASKLMGMVQLIDAILPAS